MWSRGEISPIHSCFHKSAGSVFHFPLHLLLPSEQGTETQPVIWANGVYFPCLQLRSTPMEHSAVKSGLALPVGSVAPLRCRGGGGGRAAPQPQETRRQRVQEQAPIET